MDLAALLAPYLDTPLSATQLAQLRAYLDLLLQWNARLNLTAVRDERHIVSRHFGESLFAARRLLEGRAAELVDFGSGAGFPGLPMKIYRPALRVTLIESQNKKATFLREVIRALKLSGTEVFADRGEKFGSTAELVTMRAVDKFANSLSVGASMVAPGGRLGLLIGAAQQATARTALANFSWSTAVPIPNSDSRLVLVGRKESEQ